MSKMKTAFHIGDIVKINHKPRDGYRLSKASRGNEFVIIEYFNRAPTSRGDWVSLESLINGDRVSVNVDDISHL